MSDFKRRDEHRGIPVPHIDRDHFEKSKLETRAAGILQSGPSFGPDYLPSVNGYGGSAVAFEPAGATIQGERK